MSYTQPSVLVYQELENAGGVVNGTPDLEACVVGPAYNVLRYVPGSVTSLVKTAATSAATAEASMTSGSNLLTFSVIPPFTVGDNVLVPGAADSTGAALSAKVTAADGVVLTLDTVAGATVTDVDVSKQGILVNPAISNTFNLPGQAPGQVIETSSIQMFANQAKVETLSTGFNGYTGNNVLTLSTASGTGTATATSANLTGVTNVTQFREGDTITVAGAGVAGALLTTKIVTIVGSTVTMATIASTTAATTAVTKIAVSNVNPVTSTLMIEAGDEVVLEYTDTSAVARTFTSTAIKVTAVGTISSVNIADVLPVGLSQSTTSTASIAAGAVGFTLSSTTNFATGDTIVIKGAGVGGADHEAVIGTLTGAVVTALSPATITATTGATVIVKRTRVTLKTRKLFNNQSVPATKPISGGANYVTTNASVDGTITLNPSPEVVYGKLISGTIHIPYRALRTDLSAAVMAIEKSELEGVLGEISEDNPLALGVSIALANTTTRVRAIALQSNDSVGYLEALELAQGERLYGLVPMTQDVDVCQAFAIHAQGMSIPENAAWRVAIVNTKIPTTAPVGSYTSALVNANSGNNSISVSAGKYVLTSSNSTFMSDNVTPGDTLHVTAGTGSPSPVGTMQVLEVISNQQIVVQASGNATAVSFYITRTLSKTQRAAAVAAQSTSFGSNRVIHVQPDTVIINVGGRKVVLEGFYLACAVAGLVAGFPAQQGFTNIGVAGISDISNSNFTFTRAQLNTMAAAGTFLFIQETSGSLPYVRHELTTDMSVLEYRELQQVKNWDFLSYYYYDALKSFIGKWNITADTISIIRQTITAGSESLKYNKKTRVGAPLISAVIESIEQNGSNKDNLDCRLKIKMPTTLNYLNMYLVI
jgi:hypothetical protein